jgi:hypothetical protein
MPRRREGHRRQFSAADKQRILDEASQPGVSVAEVARHYGIHLRVLRRWKQELAAMAAPTFVTVQIADRIGAAHAHVGLGTGDNKGVDRSIVEKCCKSGLRKRGKRAYL